MNAKQPLLHTHNTQYSSVAIFITRIPDPSITIQKNQLLCKEISLSCSLACLTTKNK